MDFQFAFYGFATFAASVGYACAKRAYRYAQNRQGDDQLTVPDDNTPPESASDASDSSESSLTSDGNAYDDTEPMSLKRKSTADDHDADLSERPRKRSKSPERDEPLSQSSQASELLLPSPNPEETVTMVNKQEDREVSPPAPIRESNPEPEPESPPTQAAGFAAPAPSPSSSFKGVANTGGFAGFAGTSSSSFSASPFTSPSPFGNVNANGSPSARPVWCMTPAPVFGGNEAGSGSGLVMGGEIDPFSPNNSEPLAALETRGNGKNAPVAQLTGEEDETVECELKGLKLFVKRGEKGFTGGMPGHIKLLSKKNSKKSEERLLFRREPLWKVSMNVRVRPTVRCTFDEEDNVLRVVVMEAVEDASDELVIYAFKRGRVPKKDFREFCDKIVANAGFKASSNVSVS